MIAPGFDERTEPGPRLLRDLDSLARGRTAMLASNARWQLVLSFNEWPEGRPSRARTTGRAPSGYGAYLDTLHELLPLMRIIAGARKGHTIHAPKGVDTRPTSDRVRENVFNIVAPVGRGRACARPLRGLGGDGPRGALPRRCEAPSSSSPTPTPCRAIERNLESCA